MSLILHSHKLASIHNKGLRKRIINTRFNEMGRKEERSKQGQINNKAKQHSTPHVRLEAMHEYYTLISSQVYT